MEFSEAFKLNDLLKVSTGTRSHQSSKKTAASLLESMMYSGLDIDADRSLSPDEFRAENFLTSRLFSSDIPEPEKKEEQKPELDSVVIQVVKDENFIESYAQSLCKTSNLTQSLKDSLFSKPQGGFSIVIYLFGTQDKLKISIPRKTTVEQLVFRVISAYTRDERFKSKPLPCGPVAEAYEIRLIDDADMVIEKSMKVKDLDAEDFSFIVNYSYSESQKTPISIIGEEKGKTIKVYYERNCNLVKISEESTVLNLLGMLGVRYGYLSPDEYEFKVVISLEDLSQQECDISIDSQIKFLVTDELKLYKKVYVDTPTFVEKKQEKFIPIKIEEDEEYSYDSSRQPMSNAQAILYKEYEVIKTNTRGKRQKRILGIGQFRIYNMTVKQSQKAKRKERALEESEKNILINKFKSLLDGIVQHPEILISSVHSFEQDP